MARRFAWTLFLVICGAGLLGSVWAELDTCGDASSNLVHLCQYDADSEQYRPRWILKSTFSAYFKAHRDCAVAGHIRNDTRLACDCDCQCNKTDIVKDSHYENVSSCTSHYERERDNDYDDPSDNDRWKCCCDPDGHDCVRSLKCDDDHDRNDDDDDEGHDDKKRKRSETGDSYMCGHPGRRHRKTHRQCDCDCNCDPPKSTPTPSGGACLLPKQDHKAYVCHHAAKKFFKILIDQDAVPAHLTNHGDGLPGQTINNLTCDCDCNCTSTLIPSSISNSPSSVPIPSNSPSMNLSPSPHKTPSSNVVPSPSKIPSSVSTPSPSEAPSSKSTPSPSNVPSSVIVSSPSEATPSPIASPLTTPSSNEASPSPSGPCTLRFLGPNKTYVCHVLGNGNYMLLGIDVNALPAHLGHGDGLPGQTINNLTCNCSCQCTLLQLSPSSVPSSGETPSPNGSPSSVSESPSQSIPSSSNESPSPLNVPSSAATSSPLASPSSTVNETTPSPSVASPSNGNESSPSVASPSSENSPSVSPSVSPSSENSPSVSPSVSPSSGNETTSSPGASPSSGNGTLASPSASPSTGNASSPSGNNSPSSVNASSSPSPLNGSSSPAPTSNVPSSQPSSVPIPLSSATPSPSVPCPLPPLGLDKVYVCHVLGNNGFMLLSINLNALPAHLGHGDGLPGQTSNGLICNCSCQCIPIPPSPVPLPSSGAGSPSSAAPSPKNSPSSSVPSSANGSPSPSGKNSPSIVSPSSSSNNGSPSPSGNNSPSNSPSPLSSTPSKGNSPSSLTPSPSPSGQNNASSPSPSCNCEPCSPTPAPPSFCGLGGDFCYIEESVDNSNHGLTTECCVSAETLALICQAEGNEAKQQLFDSAVTCTSTVICKSNHSNTPSLVEPPLPGGNPLIDCTLETCSGLCYIDPLASKRRSVQDSSPSSLDPLFKIILILLLILGFIMVCIFFVSLLPK